MKISISNIAWEPSEEKDVQEIMKDRHIGGVEIAPTKIWASPSEGQEDQALDYRRFWEDQGIRIVALQALLYGRPELTIFEDPQVREETLRYLERIIRLASWLGAKALVFGSPKNRKAGHLEPGQAWDLALDFFCRLGKTALEYGTVFCIEPNAQFYDCDFIRTSREGLALVEAVNHPGFGLHLDSGIMHLNGEEVEQVLEDCRGRLTHFHVSEPYLGVIGGGGGVDHARLAVQLGKIGYQGWVSIEMRNGWEDPNTKTVGRVLDFVRGIYGR